MKKANTKLKFYGYTQNREFRDLLDTSKSLKDSI